MTTTPTSISSRGARGESFADIARRLGSVLGITISSTATDQQVMNLFASALGGQQTVIFMTSVSTGNNAVLTPILSTAQCPSSGYGCLYIWVADANKASGAFTIRPPGFTESVTLVDNDASSTLNQASAIQAGDLLAAYRIPAGQTHAFQFQLAMQFTAPATTASVTAGGARRLVTDNLLATEITALNAAIQANTNSVAAAAFDIALRDALPGWTKKVTYMRVASDRFKIRVPLSYGSGVAACTHDYIEWDVWNFGPTQSPAIANCWDINGCRIKSIYGDFVVYDAYGVTGTTWMPAMQYTRMTDTTGALANRCAAGHGNLGLVGFSLSIDGAGNYINDAVGTVRVCNAVNFSGNYTLLLADGTAIGIMEVDHTFDATNGLRIFTTPNVTASGIGTINSYSGAACTTSGNYIKGAGVAAPDRMVVGSTTTTPGTGALGIYNDSQQDWGLVSGTPPSAYYIGHTAKPNVWLLVTLVYGAPESGGSWSSDTTSRVFINDKSSGESKLYVSDYSGSTPVAISGSHVLQMKYQGFIGSAA